MRTALATATVVALALTACTARVDVADDDLDAAVLDDGRDDLSVVRGEGVCQALLPAIDGNVDGLDAHADPEVLAALQARAGDDSQERNTERATPSSQPASAGAEIRVEAQNSCTIVTGDRRVTLQLVDNELGGQRAVTFDEDGSYADFAAPHDPDSIAAAVHEYRALGLHCAGDAEEAEPVVDHLVLDLAGGPVVAVTCFESVDAPTWELLRWDAANDELLTVTVQQWDQGVFEDSIVTGHLEDVEGLLVNLAIERPEGDCGVQTTWSMQDDVLALELVRARDCEADGPREPQEWPIVFSPDA